MLIFESFSYPSLNSLFLLRFVNRSLGTLVDILTFFKAPEFRQREKGRFHVIQSHLQLKYLITKAYENLHLSFS